MGYDDDYRRQAMQQYRNQLMGMAGLSGMAIGGAAYSSPFGIVGKQQKQEESDDELLLLLEE